MREVINLQIIRISIRKILVNYNNMSKTVDDGRFQRYSKMYE